MVYGNSDRKIELLRELNEYSCNVAGEEISVMQAISILANFMVEKIMGLEKDIKDLRE